MKKMILYIATIVFVLTMLTSVYADVAVKTQQGAAIIVEGAVPSKKSGVNVTVQVLKNANSINELGILPLSETSIYVDQVLSGDDGKYRFEIYLSRTIDEGQFDILVGENRPYSVQNFNIKYVSIDKIKEALSNINSAAVAVSDKELLMNNALKTTFLGLEGTKAYADYNSLADKGVALKLLIEKVKSQPLKIESDNEIKDSSGRIKDLFVLATAIGVLNNGGSEQAIDEMLIKYQQDIGIDLTVYEGLDSGSFGVGKKAVCSTILELKITNVSELQTALNKGIVLAQLNESISWSNVKIVIEEKGSIIGLKMGPTSAYSAIKDKVELYKYIAKKVPFSSLADAIDAFNNGVNAQSYSKGPSGGGGGASGGSGSIAPTVVNTPTNVITNKPNAEGNTRFTDISHLPWASEAIEGLTEKGVLNGETTNTFAPDRNITRGEFIKMILLAFDIKEATGDITFIDVENDKWYYSYIKTAYNAGIVNGQTNECFGPDENITRQDMAVIVSKAAQYKNINLSQSNTVAFSDESQFSGYALDSIYKLARAGVINGVSDGIYAPLQTATRAQAAKVIYGIIKK